MFQTSIQHPTYASNKQHPNWKMVVGVHILYTAFGVVTDSDTCIFLDFCKAILLACPGHDFKQPILTKQTPQSSSRQHELPALARSILKRYTEFGRSLGNFWPTTIRKFQLMTVPWIPASTWKSLKKRGALASCSKELPAVRPMCSQALIRKQGNISMICLV